MQVMNLVLQNFSVTRNVVNFVVKFLYHHVERNSALLGGVLHILPFLFYLILDFTMISSMLIFICCFYPMIVIQEVRSALAQPLCLHHFIFITDLFSYWWPSDQAFEHKNSTNDHYKTDHSCVVKLTLDPTKVGSPRNKKDTPNYDWPQVV